LAITVFIASGDAPSVSSGLPPVLVSSNAPLPALDRMAVASPGRPIEPLGLSPGVYKAIRHTMVVVVPKSVDDKMVIGAGDLSRFKMPCMTPVSGLEPMISPPLKIAGLGDK